MKNILFNEHCSYIIVQRTLFKEKNFFTLNCYYFFDIIIVDINDDEEVVVR